MNRTGVVPGRKKVTLLQTRIMHVQKGVLGGEWRMVKLHLYPVKGHSNYLAQSNDHNRHLKNAAPLDRMLM